MLLFRIAFRVDGWGYIFTNMGVRLWMDGLVIGLGKRSWHERVV